MAMLGSLIDWTDDVVDPSILTLDWQNPRIEADINSTQEEIVDMLVKYEKVLPLAKQIVAYGGLLPGERIIVVREGHEIIVVEGNRRVCALKLLLDPSMVPSGFKTLFPRADDTLRANISKIKAEIAPSRLAAEPVITKRHTEPGIEKWTAAAKIRRAGRLFVNGATIEEVTDALGGTMPVTRKQIREYKLLQRSLHSDQLSEQEKTILSDPELKTNPFLRFFTLKQARVRFDFKYDTNQDLISNQSSDDLTLLLAYLSRKLLLPSANGKPEFNTRSEVSDILSEWDQPTKQTSHCLAKSENEPSETNTGSEKVKYSEKGSGNSGKSNQQMFFTGFHCQISDRRIQVICEEIVVVSPDNLPLSSVFLLRALLESCLQYKTKKMKKWPQYLDYCKKRDGLESLIKFCASKQNGVFVEERQCDVLSNFLQAGFKNYADLVIHNKITEASSDNVYKAGSHLRGFLQEIADGEGE